MDPVHATTTTDLEHEPYTPLLEQPLLPVSPSKPWRPSSKVYITAFASIIFSTALVALIVTIPNNQSHDEPLSSLPTKNKSHPLPRGVAEGVSAKSRTEPVLGDGMSFNWSNAMLSWQRSAYHFQPAKNWMNDPDGPLFHKGWYHLFYQYDPDSAVWGNITWGHAVSTDLIHWFYLPLAMVPDQWYDINGVWTGSATLLPDGQIRMLYTGDTYNSVQVQNLAYPANISDPLLLHWVKYPGNPVITPPSWLPTTEFRDPTTAWMGPDGTWRVTIGSTINSTGLALVYRTSNFSSYELLDGYLHAVPDTGMWECVDFYPVAINGSNGLDTSANGPTTKHVLKASLDDKSIDVYALGTYDPVTDRWTPDDPIMDVGIGLRVDYGKYYASKTFYDQKKKRRVLWGWIAETDSELANIEKGWASIQTIPRTVLFDNKTGSNIIQWPVDETESLRLNSTEFQRISIGAGSVVPLDVGSATQLDIFAEFEIELLSNTSSGDCGCGDGAADRSSLGPFGLLVIADKNLSELTPVYFRPAVNSTTGNVVTYFCADESRSSLAPDVTKLVYGSSVPVLDDEKFEMRILVDHSIVESFAQGGRTVITSRIYPTEAIYGAAKLFLFNNATGVNVKASLKIWKMNSAFIHPFPLDQI